MSVYVIWHLTRLSRQIRSGTKISRTVLFSLASVNKFIIRWWLLLWCKNGRWLWYPIISFHATCIVFICPWNRILLRLFVPNLWQKNVGKIYIILCTYTAFAIHKTCLCVFSDSNSTAITKKTIAAEQRRTLSIIIL